jgi:hypothetical protein
LTEVRKEFGGKTVTETRVLRVPEVMLLQAKQSRVYIAEVINTGNALLEIRVFRVPEVMLLQALKGSRAHSCRGCGDRHQGV